MKKLKSALIVFISILSSSVYAGPYSYSCVIEKDYLLSNNGSLSADHVLYSGFEFNVDRSSGHVLGDVISNASYANKIVLDAGSDQQAFKAIWFSKEFGGTNSGRNAQYLSVEEFEDGPSKPFVLVEGSRVLTGVCS